MILGTGIMTSVVPLSVQWDAADLQAGAGLGVVLIDQTGMLTRLIHCWLRVSRQVGSLRKVMKLRNSDAIA
jgi:hypothetical protein